MLLYTHMREREREREMTWCDDRDNFVIEQDWDSGVVQLWISRHLVYVLKKKKKRREKEEKKVNYVERDFFYVLLEMNEVEAKIVLFFEFLILT